MNATFWLDVLKALIGTFAGAFLGFGSALLIQHIQRRRDDLAAGNLAVFTLAQQLNDFLIVSTGFNQVRQETLKEAPNLPLWASSKPIHFAFNASLRYDFQKLGFLAAIDHPVLEKLALMEKQYLALEKLVKDHAEVFRTIQRRTAEAAYKQGELVQIDTIEAIIGSDLVAQANSFTSAIIERVDRDEPDYRDVGAALTAALQSHFGERTLFRKKRVILKLGATKDKFATDPATLKRGIS
jgi:hypothetical protein